MRFSPSAKYRHPAAIESRAPRPRMPSVLELSADWCIRVGCRFHLPCRSRHLVYFRPLYRSHHLGHFRLWYRSRHRPGWPGQLVNVSSVGLDISVSRAPVINPSAAVAKFLAIGLSISIGVEIEKTTSLGVDLRASRRRPIQIESVYRLLLGFDDSFVHDPWAVLKEALGI